MNLKAKFLTVVCNKTFGLVLLVSILEICNASTFVWTSPTLPTLHLNNTNSNPLHAPITQYQDCWISSMLLVGQLTASIPFSMVCHRIGRKISLLSCPIFFILAYLILAFSHDVRLFYAARAILGAGIGVAWIILPLYIVEIAEDSNRGLSITTTAVFSNFGMMVTYAIGPFLTFNHFNVVLATIPALFFLLFLVFGMESPCYLIKMQRVKEAKCVLRNLKNISDDKLVDEYIAGIEEKQRRFDTSTANLLHLFNTRRNLKALLFLLVLTASKQMSGSAVYLFYSQDIFSNATKSIPAYMYPIITGFISFISSFICPLFVDSLGRRPLLLTSFLGMALANFSLGTYFYLQQINPSYVLNLESLPVISIVFYTLFKNMGVGTLMWTMTSELIAPNLHSYAFCVYTICNQMTIFALTSSFKLVVERIGKGETFWGFGVWCLCALTVCFFLPETKGKCFSDIQKKL